MRLPFESDFTNLTPRVFYRKKETPMKMARMLVVAGAFTLAACLTINVYFPAAAVQAAADNFVQDVQSDVSKTPGNGASEKAPAGKEQSRFSIDFIGTAHADDAGAIAINTPEATRLKSSMKSRSGDIAGLKSKGAVGEDRMGLLAERDLQGLALPERAKAKQVVNQENADRMALYREIVRANSYPQDKLAEIQKIFAKSWQGNSQSGWWVQGEDGAWAKR